MADGYYDRAAAEQQERVALTRDMVAQRDAVRRLLTLKLGERVLDVGSGNGILAREMLQDVGPSGEVVGVDPAESMVSMAAKLCPGATFQIGDAQSLPVNGEHFDAIAACQVLCFVPDVDAALSEMFRALNPGGRLVILDTDWDSLVWNCRDSVLLERVIAELTKPYTSAHVPRTLSRRLASAGFTITERRVHPIVNWDMDEASYSAQLAGFLPVQTGTNASPREKDGTAWIAEQSMLADKGEYMFSMNRYIFCACKL